MTRHGWAAALLTSSLVIAVTGAAVVLRAGGDTGPGGDVLAVAPAPLGLDRLSGDEHRQAAATPPPVAAPPAPVPVPAGTGSHASPRAPRVPTGGRTAGPGAAAGPRSAAPAPVHPPVRNPAQFVPAGATRFPFDPSRTEYSTTQNGITLTARFDRMTARTGELLALRLQAEGAEYATVAFGDGHDWAEMSGTGCINRGAQPARTRLERSHAWNGEGRWTLVLEGAVPSCGGPTDPRRSAAMTVDVEILPGTYSSNGPDPVRVDVGTHQSATRPDDPYWVSFSGMAQETDGYISRMELDVGDGSPVVVFPGDSRPCRTGSTGQPIDSDAELPGPTGPTYEPSHEHRYPQKGTYTVTLRAWSTGCDGRDVQTGTATTQTWTVS